MELPSKQTQVFAHSITVLPEHLDERLHVNNVVFVQFLQDIAHKHWLSVGDETIFQTTAWVVRRHEIDYLQPAQLDDALLIQTWTGSHSAVTWNRHYTITRPSDKTLLVQATSCWVLVDPQSLRPKRITDDILRLFEQ